MNERDIERFKNETRAAYEAAMIARRTGEPVDGMSEDYWIAVYLERERVIRWHTTRPARPRAVTPPGWVQDSLF